MKLIVDFQDADIRGKWPISNNICCIVTTYNQENFIEEVLESILTQDDVDFHILIHDDASTDSTLRKILYIQSQNPNQITVISQKTNQWSRGIPISARLINSVNSEFIALCEGDDYWKDRNKLFKQLNYLQNNLDCGLVFHDIEIENSSKNYEYEKNLKDALSVTSIKKIFDHLDLAKGNFIMTCTVFFKKKAIRPEYFNSMHDVLPGDWLFFSHISERYKLHFMDEKMATYRLHKSNSWANSTSSYQVLNFINAYWFASSRIAEVVRPAYQRELISHLWNLGEIEDYDNPIIEYRIKYDELNKTNNELNKTNNELNKTNNELNKTYNQLINSRSWRLTQPLRSLKGMLKGVKKY
jgi:glycosyltransferase involved in cell wall biosynthesis